MKKSSFFLAFITVTILLVTSCSAPAGETTPAHTSPPPTTPGDDISILVDGNTEFTFDLYRELKDSEGNFFFSPYSISTALAMTYAGARGETEQQMADTLYFTLPQERLHAAFSALENSIKERGRAITTVLSPEGETIQEEVDGFRLNIANALWGQKDYSFLQDFLDLLQAYYGSGLSALDFINEPEESRLAINQWASEQTEGRIEDIIPPGVIDAFTRLVLANAIYFNAHWQHQFSESATHDGVFHLLDGDNVNVPMMHQEEQFDYAEGDNYQAIRLPYLGNEFAMTVLLPVEGQFEDFDNSLDAQILNDITSKFESQRVALTLPRFQFESSFQLNQALSDMGMPNAFSGGADFSGMTGNTDLFIGSVLHKSFVAVDEEGTEAAAVTAVIMVLSAPPPATFNFTADRPFIFLIQDIETESILFMGRVLNPAA
ncbi:MAG: serpin family protein [Dehalococcoidales bacterium]|nr:serpin family protein [Dehalococcoidales bacterium]